MRDIASSSNFICGGRKCINSKQLCTCKGECYIVLILLARSGDNYVVNDII